MIEKHQPYYHKGRYYNHMNDRIAPRIKDFIKMAGLTGARYIKKKLRLTDTAPVHAHELESWKITQPLNHAPRAPSITWLGHATFLIQLNGLTIITDPVLHEISRILYPRTMHPPHHVETLPQIDYVLISHNHPDHCHEKTLRIIAERDNPTMLIPIGNKKRFSKLGIHNLHEHTWWDEHQAHGMPDGGMKFVFLPAYHWTSRGIFDINRTLWGSWLIAGDATIYFAGDTAYSNHFSSIQHYYHPIDIAIMPIGPDQPRHLMKDAHVGPEEAIRGFHDLQATHFIPMHWGTFPGGIDTFHHPINLLHTLWNTNQDAQQQRHLRVMKFGEQWTFHPDNTRFLSSQPT